MIRTLRLALSIADAETRRRLVLTVPASIVVALLEAAGFGLLFLLLQALDDRDRLVEGPLSWLYEMSGLGDHGTFLWAVGIGIATLMLTKSIAAVALLWWQTGLVSRGEAQSSSELFEAYMHASLPFHLRTNSAYLIRNVIGSMTIVYQNVLLGLVTAASEAAVVVVVALLLFAVDPVVALLTSALLGAAALGFVKGFAPWSRRLGRHNQMMQKAVLQSAAEGIEGVTMAQVLNQQHNVSRRFADVRDEWASSRAAMLFVVQLPRYYLEFIVLLGVSAIGLGAAAFTSGTETVAVIGVMIAAALRMMPSLNKILSAVNKIQVGKRAAVELHAELEHIESMRADQVRSASAEPIPFERTLELQDLSFTYDGADRPALHNLDLVIRQGESLGVVGRSGSGKSTLINVLLGLLWPDGGCINVDGEPLTKGALPGWRRQIGYVPQHIFLADRSLRENVAFGVPEDDIDEDRVRHAIGLALLGHFVATLPEGLDTVTGEHGARLSGGQRQRIGIARALYHGPQLLLLDEATSALDTITEAAVAQTIESLQSHMTIVIVAHRLSTVRGCDRILLMRDGAIEASGSFDELRTESEAFAEMVHRSRSELTDAPIAAHEEAPVNPA